MRGEQQIRRRTNTRGCGVGRKSVLVLVALLFFATATLADVRDQVFSIGLATRNLYLVNANGTVTSQFANYSGTASAAGAQRASDGMIFFITQVANGQVFTWNPATPATKARVWLPRSLRCQAYRPIWEATSDLGRTAYFTWLPEQPSTRCHLPVEQLPAWEPSAGSPVARSE